MGAKVLLFLISLTLISLPLYLIRCKNLSFCVSPIPFTLLEFLILVTFFTWFVGKYQKKKNISKIIKEIRAKIPLILQVLFLIFLASSAVSVLFSPNKLAALGEYKAYFLEPFLFFIVILDYLSEKNQLKIIYWSFLTAGIWISLLATLEKVFNYSPFNSSEFLERGRTSAIYQTSNWVGLLVGPITIILLGYCLHLFNEKKTEVIFGIKEIYWAIGGLAIVLSGIYASGSRGAMLGLVAGLGFFFGYISYRKIKQKLLKNIIKTAFMSLTVIYFIVNLFFLFNINSAIKANNKSAIFPQVASRLCLWETAAKIIKEKPLTGSGLAGFATENNLYHTCSQEQTTYPHNIFLNFWTETGIFGLISFIGICSWFFFKLLKTDKINYLRLGLASCFIGILFHGLVDVPYLKNDLAVQFWVILGLSLYLINQESLFTVRVRQVVQKLQR